MLNLTNIIDTPHKPYREIGIYLYVLTKNHVDFFYIIIICERTRKFSEESWPYCVAVLNSWRGPPSELGSVSRLLLRVWESLWHSEDRYWTEVIVSLNCSRLLNRNTFRFYAVAELKTLLNVGLKYPVIL